MTQEQSLGASASNRTERWLNVMLSLAVGAGFFALWFWLLAGVAWLSGRDGRGGAHTQWLYVSVNTP